MLFIFKLEASFWDVSSRLKYDTEELGRELNDHVYNLRSTLDNMSKRFYSSSDSDA